jgi:ferric-dicitrate binding protein FerR (iron transport regulator)
MKFKTAKPSDEAIQTSFGNFLEKLERETLGKSSRANSFSIYYKIAAAITILLISVAVVLQFTKNIGEQNNISEIKLIQKSTPSVGKTQIKLPDGTMVWLHSNSSLVYPIEFGEIREVSLTGEAYFEVVENIHKPFIVKTDNSEVKVLGTSFNINAYKGMKRERISLVSGKVEVKIKASNILSLLSHGEEISIDIQEGTGSINRFNISEVVGWKDGLLVFNEANLDQIFLKLETWYGVEIALQNKPMEPWKFNGYFKGQSLEVVLNRLGFAKDFKYKIEGKKVKIEFL